MLTRILKYANDAPSGDGYMGGSCHYSKTSKRWFVSIYWNKVRYRIFKYNGEPIYHEKTAQKLLNKIRAEIDDGLFNPSTYFPDSPLSLKVYSEQWLKASTACKATKSTYRKSIRKAVKHLGSDFDIRHFSYSQLSILVNDLDLAPKGKYNVLNTLKTMLNHAYRDEVIKKVAPFPKLTIGLPDEIVYLSRQKQRGVLNAIPERHRGVFEFGMIYGLRIGELRALQKDCIQDGILIIKRSFSDFELRETTKTNRVRRYVLTPRAKEILSGQKTIYPFSPFVFPSDKGKAYSNRMLRKIWKEACQKVGVNIELKNAIRHSLGCQLLDEGIEMELVRDIYGHTSTQTTRRYARRSPERIAEVLLLREIVKEKENEEKEQKGFS